MGGREGGEIVRQEEAGDVDVVMVMKMDTCFHNNDGNIDDNNNNCDNDNVTDDDSESNDNISNINKTIFVDLDAFIMTENSELCLILPH